MKKGKNPCYRWNWAISFDYSSAFTHGG